jgi:hypothetical protein
MNGERLTMNKISGVRYICAQKVRLKVVNIILQKGETVTKQNKKNLSAPKTER